jgi:Flp pilus assembly protein TadD
MGEYEKAIHMMKMVLEENTRMDGIRPLYAIFLARNGQMEKAREQLTPEALSISKADHDMAYWVGAAYAVLGEKDSAFEWLNRAIRLGNENKPLYETDKSLESLRDDERFKTLLEKL